MNIIAGIEGNRPAITATAKRLGVPVMLSANSIWTGTRFSYAWVKQSGLDVHLDSGGFVAMKRYGGFRFSVEEYGALAADLRPLWWAQMDLCCEPEIASNRAEVIRRIDRTAANLHECRAVAARHGAAPPLLVLQGWQPADYVSGPAFDDPAFQWPDIVGVGSVCRRQIHGPDGILAVVAKLDRTLPPHVRFHLFGVKSAAAEVLKEHHRIASVDSMAWAKRAREVCRIAKVPCTNAVRAQHMEAWVEKQRARTATTPDLFS